MRRSSDYQVDRTGTLNQYILDKQRPSPLGLRLHRRPHPGIRTK